MAPRTLQALLTRRPNRFALDQVYVLGYVEDGVELGIVHADEGKDRIEVHLGDVIELGKERWQVYNIVPGVEIPEKGVASAAPPRAVVQLELKG